MGEIIQRMAADNNISIEGLFTFAETVSLFELNANGIYNASPNIDFDVHFRNNIGQTLWDNGIRFPEMLQNPFEMAAALAIANGDFNSVEEYINHLIERDEVFYVNTGEKKVNPKEETKCFDVTKPTKVTIYVEQPIEGSRKITAYVGHTFIGIEQEGISRCLGYYPKNQMPSLVSDQVAEIHDNSGSPYHVSISTEVSPDQLKKVIDHIINFPDTYFLNTYNCSDFGIDIGRRAGLNLPKTIGVYEQLFFKFEGRNPSDLGEDIRAMNSTPNITIEKTGGNAPVKKGGC